MPNGDATPKKAKPKSHFRFTLSTANKVLSLFAVLVLAYFIINIVLETLALSQISNYISKVEGQNQTSGQASGELEQWVSNIGVPKPLPPPARNVFQPYTYDDSGEGMTQAFNPSKNYRLVGIANADDPDIAVAMIENTKTKMTTFLQFGPEVDGLTLEKIQDNKVIVNIGGTSFELE